MRSTTHDRAARSARPRRGPAVGATGATVAPDLDLSYQSGLEVKARSQWAYARIRFFRHRLAVASLIILIVAALVAIFANSVAPYGYDEQDLQRHPAGPDAERLAPVRHRRARPRLPEPRHLRAPHVALGGVLRRRRGHGSRHDRRSSRRLLRRKGRQPAHAVHRSPSRRPGPRRPARRSRRILGQGKPVPQSGLILAFLLWMNLARVVRGPFLSLREKEFVEAAQAAGRGRPADHRSGTSCRTASGRSSSRRRC